MSHKGNDIYWEQWREREEAWWEREDEDDRWIQKMLEDEEFQQMLELNKKATVEAFKKLVKK